MEGFNFLTFAADGNVSALSERFASSMFPSGGSQTYMYHTNAAYDALATNARGSTDIRGQMFDGMFHGVPGKYACTASPCSVSTNNRGEISTLGGTWTFTPNNLQTGVTGHMVQGAVNDTDYLTFGYWVQEDDEDGEIGVGTFVDGTRLNTTYASALVNLEGTAEYEGKAGGKFVRKTLASDGAATIVDGGVFTADANLTARFGGDDISLNDKFTVVGTVDNFQDGDGDVIDPKWSVMLGKAGFTTSEDKSTTGAAFTGQASGGGPAGTWGGSFYGASPPETADEPQANSGGNNDAYPVQYRG